MMFFIIIILSLYFATILLLIYGFTKVKKYDSIGLKPKTTFTIVVPFRNETTNLPILLESISKMNYSMDLFEVILVDDDSEEVFSVQYSLFSVQLIENIRKSNSPKKDAITTAMQIAKNDWIITTDADCVVPENWLLSLDNYIQNHDVKMIAGAVTYETNDSFLHHFQKLDLASLQGATIGSFGIGKGFMCNGANLAYAKTFFQDLNGFQGNNTIASGDDVFLLQKAIEKFPEKVHYLKSENNIISTKALDDWKSLFHQRVRWASKTTSYQSTFGKALGLLVFAGNIAFLLAIYFWLFGNQNHYLFLLLASKLSVDFILIHKTNQFLKTKTLSFLLSSLLYPFFSVCVVLYSLFGKYEWKGRLFSK
jgi:cellulose synthase/poly-beta-1,6-N-acetylglucosamine synthase-like glycosyltransferase